MALLQYTELMTVNQRVTKHGVLNLSQLFADVLENNMVR